MRPLATRQELRERLSDCGAAAFNHAGFFLDQGVRALLLLFAYVLISAGEFLEREERELASRTKPLEVRTS